MREAEIIATGQKLAAQLGAVFVIDRRKLNDFRTRRVALSPNGDGK